MFIPELFFGTSERVSLRIRKVTAYYLKNRDWPDELLSNMIDTQDKFDNQPLVLFEDFPGYNSENHFRMFYLSYFFDQLGGYEQHNIEQNRNQFFDDLIEYPWGILCILSVNTILPWLGESSIRRATFFANLLKYWEVFLAGDQLFSVPGANHLRSRRFWNFPSSQLFKILNLAGVPLENILGEERTPDPMDVPRAINEHKLQIPPRAE